MPIYEYLCNKCNLKFEIRQLFSDDPILTCQDEGCDGEVTKLISTPGIHFKGSGWYVNDYSDKFKNKDSGKSESKKDTSDKKNETTKSDKPSCSSSCGMKNKCDPAQ